MEGEVELFVGGVAGDPQRDVFEFGGGGGGGVVEVVPGFGGVVENQRVRVAGVAEGEFGIGGEVGHGDGGGEAACLGHFGELLVHGGNETALVDVVHEAADEGAEGARRFGDGGAMTCDISDHESGDAAGATGGDEVDISAGGGVFEGDGVDPHIEAGDAQGGIDGLIAAPDFEGQARPRASVGDAGWVMVLE